MALALLWPEELGDSPQTLRLRFDIGHNRYYAWQMGDEERITRNGLSSIANVAQRSRVFGPLPESSRGRGVLEIPAAQVSKQNRFVQLLSFRTEDGVGPAISPILELDWTRVARGAQSTAPIEDLPPPALFAPPSSRTKALSATYGGMQMSVASGYSASRPPPVDAAPMRWHERDLSQGMFLQGLLAALPSILPSVTNILGSAAPMIGQLFGGAAPGASAAPAAGGAPPAGAAQVVQLIQQLLSGAGAAGAQAGGAAGAVTDLKKIADDVKKKLEVGGTTQTTTAGTTQALALGSLGTRAARCMPKSYARSRAAGLRARRSPARALSMSAAPAPYVQAQEYSQAMIAPALLAALPALMPLLQQVLSPENIKTVVDAPQKMTGQVINGVLDMAKLGLQATEAEREHLRKLNPGVDDPALQQLLMSMSQGLAAAQRLNYRRVSSVKLSFDDVQTQMLFGRTRVLYRKDRALQFPMSVSTPQTISKARLVVQIKHPDTLAVLVEDGEDVGELASGPIPLVPRIDEAQLAKLEPNQDYIVIATLMWRTKKGSQVGTSMQQRITLIGEYSFDRLEESGDPIPAADFEQYRDLWHKVWQGDFGAGAHSARLNCRYYLVLNPKRTNNARLDTVVEAGDGDQLGGKLKAGMEYSPYVLNHLLTRLDSNAQSLGDAELEALSGRDFVERFNQAAQFSGKLKGRKGERGALWVYPEFKIQTLVLTRADEVDDNGNVRSLAESRVKFPMPVLMHFVGVKGA